MPTTIRPAALADAPALIRLAADTFRDTFGPDNRPADLDDHIGEAFAPERQAAKIADARGVVLLAERPDAKAPGRGTHAPLRSASRAASTR